MKILEQNKVKILDALENGQELFNLLIIQKLKIFQCNFEVLMIGL